MQIGKFPNEVTNTLIANELGVVEIEVIQLGAIISNDSNKLICDD